MENLKFKLLDWLPFILLAIPVSVMMYIKYGNPSDGFMDTLNTISAWIFVSPLLLIVWGLFDSMFNSDEEPKSCKCCCCKCHCCEGEN